MARFHLYWVSTQGQWDDGFVVARTARAAASYVRHENFAFDPKWARAEKVVTLPEHLQDPSNAVASTSEEPCHAHWASPEVLSSCGITIVHAASPRVFLWEKRILTEGILDYLQGQRAPGDRGRAAQSEALAADDSRVHRIPVARRHRQRPRWHA